MYCLCTAYVCTCNSSIFIECNLELWNASYESIITRLYLRLYKIESSFYIFIMIFWMFLDASLLCYYILIISYPTLSVKISEKHIKLVETLVLWQLCRCYFLTTTIFFMLNWCWFNIWWVCLLQVVLSIKYDFFYLNCCVFHICTWLICAFSALLFICVNII